MLLQRLSIPSFIKSCLILLPIITTIACNQHSVQCVIYNNSSHTLTVQEKERTKRKSFLRFLKPEYKKFDYAITQFPISPRDTFRIDISRDKNNDSRIRHLILFGRDGTIADLTPSFLVNNKRTYVVTVADHKTSTVIKLKQKTYGSH